MGINKAFEKSLDGSLTDFVQFIDVNSPNDGELDINEIDYLAKRVALNLFYYEDNVATAKSDYILLLALLKKKGVVFESVKPLK